MIVLRIVLLGLVLSCGAMLGACNIIGYVAHTAGAPAVPAEFVLPPRPTVVYVTDQPDPMGAKIESDEVAGQIEKQLQTFNLVPVVPSSQLSDLRSSRPADFATLTPAQLGKAAGAEQVIFVAIQQSTIKTEGVADMLHGVISAQVRVYDTQTGALMWPGDLTGGMPINFSTPTLRISDSNNPSSVERLLCEGLAVNISKLFRSYKPDE